VANFRRGEAGGPIRALFDLGPTSALGDGQLLERFAGRGGGEAAGAAFEALVARHGPMVLRVCRGALGDRHDAEDAFQAVFLVLARKAGSIRDRDSVASWLHGVALRVAARARAAGARRRRHERLGAGAAGRSEGDDGRAGIASEVHEAVGRLPEFLRAPVVLCYLEGHSREDAARLLRRPVGTVKSRLSRARDRLRRRLARLDPSLSSEASLGSFFPGPQAVPPRLVDWAAGVAAGSPASTATPGALALAAGVLQAMSFAHGKALTVAVVSTLAIAGALAVGARRQGPGRDAAKSQASRVEPRQPDPTPILGRAYIPRDLEAHVGVGVAVTYALDPRGERIVDEAAAKAEAARRAARKDAAPAEAVQGPFKEVGTALRWVAVVGVFDHQAVREAEARRQGVGMIAPSPAYKRVEIERQVRRPGGDWSAWMPVDHGRNYQILDNLPEVAFERLAYSYRPENLVDPLPHLLQGRWEGVDAEALLRLAGPDPVEVSQGLPIPGPDGAARGLGRPKPEVPVLMIRSLDFTVEPGTNYRYRVRVVVQVTDKAGRRSEELWPWSGPTADVVAP